MASKFIRTYTSFSGADLIVNFGPIVVGELQQITYGVQREKAPIYTLGNADVRSFSRGKRAVAGNCVFAVFDRDALIEELTADETWKLISPEAMFTAKGNLITQNNEDFTNALELLQWNRVAATGKIGNKKDKEGKDELDKNGNPKKEDWSTKGSDAVKDKYGNILMNGQGARGSGEDENNGNNKDNPKPEKWENDYTKTGYSGAYVGDGDNWSVGAATGNSSNLKGSKIRIPPGFGVINNTNICYADMLPPLDITMTFANEYGQAAFQKIYDLEFLNDSSGVSIDSIVTERQMTWVARRISPLISGVYTRNSNGNVRGRNVSMTIDPNETSSES